MRAFPFVMVMVVIVATMVACGGDDDGAKATATASISTRSDITPVGRTTAATPPAGAMELGAGSGEGGTAQGVLLAAGTYYSETFSPRFVVTLGDGWGNAGQQASQSLLLRKPEPGDIALTIDSAGNRDVAATVSALTSVRGTQASDVTDAQVAGMPAKQFDVTVVEEIAGPVRIPALADVYSTFEGDMLRVWVLDVRGRTVKILAEAQAAEFEAFVQIVEQLIRTMRFE